MQRRDMIKLLGMTSGGLLLGAHATGCSSISKKDVESIFDSKSVFEPNAFLSIHTDGRILLAVNKSEMGQGIMTASATLAAEELEVSVGEIEVFQAYKREFGMQMTGGSNSTKGIFTPIRKAAATAREMLRAAAAEEWGVAIEECVAKEGSIHHSSGKSLSYGDLSQRASRQSIPNSPPLKERSAFDVIGKPGIRVDALDKSTGKAKFGTDVNVEGKVCAYVIRAPIMGGKVKNLNSEVAEKQVGVLKIFTFERGVAVVAQKYWQAQRAAKLVEVEWEDGSLKGFDTDELAEAARQRSREKGDHSTKNVGNVDSVFKKEEVTIIETQYDYPFLSHATMEPQNCTAVVYEDRAKLWVPTQAPTVCAKIAASYLNLPIENIDVEVMMLGGGFGRRACVDFVKEALYIAQKYPNVPVQVMWTREDDMTLGYYRPQGTCRIKGAIDENGDVVAVYSHLVTQIIFPDMADSLGGMFPTAIPPKFRQKVADATAGVMNTSTMMGFFEGGELVISPYDIPNFRADFTPIRTQVPVTAWRSVAHSYSTFIIETFLDQLIQTGMESAEDGSSNDPIDMRKKMLSKHPRHVAVLESAIENSNWNEPIEEGWGRGVAISEFAGTVVAQVAEAGIVNDQIVVRHITCATECGIVVNPDIVKMQIESGIVYGLSMIHEKIELVDGVVQQRNFDTFPVLRMNQTPEIKTILLPSDNKPTGIGEIALPPVNAAVSNAIFAATGKRLTNMPLQEDWLSQNKITKATP